MLYEGKNEGNEKDVMTEYWSYLAVSFLPPITSSEERQEQLLLSWEVLIHSTHNWMIIYFAPEFWGILILACVKIL